MVGLQDKSHNRGRRELMEWWFEESDIIRGENTMP